MEESRNILSANAGVVLGQLRSCKDESFLDNAPLASLISVIGGYCHAFIFVGIAIHLLLFCVNDRDVNSREIAFPVESRSFRVSIETVDFARDARLRLHGLVLRVNMSIWDYCHSSLSLLLHSHLWIVAPLPNNVSR